MAGPFALWEHEHRFTPRDGGVLMQDRVRYALPLGPLGAVAHVVAVRAALAAIFDHRFACVDERFAGKPGRAGLAPPAREPLQEAGRGRGR